MGSHMLCWFVPERREKTENKYVACVRAYARLFPAMCPSAKISHASNLHWQIYIGFKGNCQVDYAQIYKSLAARTKRRRS